MKATQWLENKQPNLKIEKDLSGLCLKEDTKMPISPGIQVMQIKTRMRQRLTPVTMASSKGGR